LNNSTCPHYNEGERELPDGSLQLICRDCGTRLSPPADSPDVIEGEFDVVTLVDGAPELVLAEFVSEVAELLDADEADIIEVLELSPDAILELIEREIGPETLADVIEAHERAKLL
jgi:hypothetical protein